MKQLTPAEMSAHTGLPVSTLHYYEQIGLLDEVARAANGHRRYSEDDLVRVQFLKHVRATGMSLEQMHHFVNLHRAGSDTLPERLAILQDHREVVKAQIHELQQTLHFIEAKIEIVNNLQGHAHTPAKPALGERPQIKS